MNYYNEGMKDLIYFISNPSEACEIVKIILDDGKYHFVAKNFYGCIIKDFGVENKSKSKSDIEIQKTSFWKEGTLVQKDGYLILKYKNLDIDMDN